MRASHARKTCLTQYGETEAVSYNLLCEMIPQTNSRKDFVYHFSLKCLQETKKLAEAERAEAKRCLDVDVFDDDDHGLRDYRHGSPQLSTNILHVVMSAVRDAVRINKDSTVVRFSNLRLSLILTSFSSFRAVLGILRSLRLHREA